MAVFVPRVLAGWGKRIAAPLHRGAAMYCVCAWWLPCLGCRVWRRLLLAADFRGNGEAFAAFCAAACEDFATVCRSHACAESVFVYAFAVMGLVCTFHCLIRRLMGFKGKLFYYAAFFDAGFFAGECAEVVEFCAAYLAVFVHGD